MSGRSTSTPAASGSTSADVDTIAKAVSDAVREGLSNALKPNESAPSVDVVQGQHYNIPELYLLK